jgi:signal transduction histidine kinase
MADANRTGSDFTVHHRTLWPDGTVRWVTGAGRVQLDTLGNPVRAVGISIDTTDHHLLQEQYQQAQKMEAIGRLAGGVAHDFNNLLAAILGSCELLLADVGEDDPHRADINEIQKAGNTAAGLTRQLLAFSRKQIVEPTQLDLNVVVTDMHAMLVRLIREDVTIVMRLAPGEARITADRAQVEQILLNLAVNARDAMPEGGTLTVTTGSAAGCHGDTAGDPAVDAGAYVGLTVTDTGGGMPAEVLARAFEPFFTTKAAGKGTGLGLATVHAIATQGGGRVRVSSTVGSGTCVTVYFPRCDRVGERPGPPLGAPRGRGETVLLVEDADALRHLAVRLLERLGYKVLAASGAEAAMALFDAHVVDLLLTDVVMPGASGLELARRLLERRPSLKVIYISGYTEDVVAHDALARGIGFLHKPFTSAELGRKIHQALQA